MAMTFDLDISTNGITARLLLLQSVICTMPSKFELNTCGVDQDLTEIALKEISLSLDDR